MPGWRLGWVIIPKLLTDNFMKLSQNLFISSGNIAQYSALKVFENINELRDIVRIYESNRDIVYEILSKIPIISLRKPNGSFYFYIDISLTKENSFNFVEKLLHETGVVLTPGFDFDKKFGKNTVRLSFSPESRIIVEAVEKFSKWLKKNY